MGYCKECFEHIRSDCVLTNGVCVFCHYKTNEWDSNGQIVKKKDVLQDWGKSFLTWRNYYQNYFREIKKAIENLPKGSFIKKKIKGHWYYYLIYRNKNKVVFKYYGKMIPESLKAKIELRKDLVRKLSKIKSLLYSLRITARSSKKFSRFDILKKDNFTCQYCGRTPKDGVKLHVDHIIPLDKGGYHSKENLITTCQECNLEKHDKYS
ncbi:MAG: hypothetical protein COS11_07680 [bacterium (Candidatus Ratteibacteria) CG01_land_8_20_14_3_00_40_19]|uniref:HNH nuclease domain-containing protein n=1 Tax=bacterium (Candidatus Ratteibacteria) CG01_land_8_20_14_3_00_40_19 TaxID=2014290 RepID=A0A2M7E6N1_9BACT|nr:MAG: hypothetical protein COS11_07680 [bacterium (Candidatus Ratteibacteria) CG01_land_8_20_14_3_00_40_19]